MKSRKPGAAGARTTGRKAAGFTDDERAAMREHVRELKAAARRAAGGGGPDAEAEVLAKIAAMKEPDRAMARRLHALIKAGAPGLAPRLWYGMPAYERDGKVVCWFQGAHKFKARYGMLGFSDKAHLDEGAIWPVAFALTELTAAAEQRIAALLEKAVGEP